MRSHLRFTIVCVSLLAGPPVACAQLLSCDDQVTCPDRRLKVDEVAEGRSCVLRARLTGVLEATVAVSATLVNAESSVPLPLTADVYGEEPMDLTKLRARSILRKWFFGTRFRWCPGRRGGAHDESHVYALPYDSGRAFVVVQGALGAYSHGPGSGSEQAVDFAMPSGSTVRAARSGVVVAVRQDSALGGPERRFESCANYVIVRHSDGTYASYAHIQRYSALVEAGHSVEVGAALGLSGSTGFSSAPHLHFDVYRPIDGALRETIAVSFRTATGVVRDLQPGEEYARP